MAEVDVRSTELVERNGSRRTFLVAGGFLAVAAAALAITPRNHERTLGLNRLSDVIPTNLGQWSLAPESKLVLPDSDSPSDVYDQVLTRTYVAPGLPAMMLLIAYGAAQSGLMKVHRPEICYASSGFTVRGTEPIDVRTTLMPPIAAKTFVATRDDRTERVLYWTRISDAFPRDLTNQRLVMLELGIRGIIPDGVLVRCSSLDTAGSDTQPALVSFVRSLILSVGRAGREVLVGQSRSVGPGGKVAGR